MYGQQQTPPGFTPQSDGRRIIFPLSFCKGTFKTDNFFPSLVDHRCSIDDINYFLNDIYYQTRRMAAIRSSTRLVIWSLVLFIFCFICGISMELDNDFDNYDSEYDDTGFFLILVGMLSLVFLNIVGAVIRSTGKSKLFRQVVGVLEKHKTPFLQKGLRWSVPENCQWLELWMDYRYFSPYYMQPYIPQQQQISGSPYYVQQLPQQLPLQSPTPRLSRQASQTGETTQVTVDGVQTPKVALQEQQPSVGTNYPQLELPQINHYHQHPAALRPPVSYPFPQPQNPQAYGYPPQQFGYNFYQPPALNETLLSTEQPEVDNQRLLRPY